MNHEKEELLNERAAAGADERAGAGAGADERDAAMASLDPRTYATQRSQKKMGLRR